MKVLQFITRMDLGGAQEVCLDLCRTLAAGGHEVHLLTGTGGELLADAAATRGLVLHAWPDWQHAVAPADDLRCALRLVRLLRRERYDVLHTHSSKAGFVGRLAAAVARTPTQVVHHVHGWSFNRTQRAPVRVLYRALERLAARPGFLLLACSRATDAEGRVLAIGREADRRIVVNGVDRRPQLRRRDRQAIRRRIGLGRRDLLYLQLGNLKPQKDPLTFATAAVLGGAQVRRAAFWIAGAGPLADQARRVADLGGLGPRFRVLGWRRDVDDLLAAADVLVLSSRFEGLPMAVLRAMAAGLPVVATAVDGTPEAVVHGQTGYLFEPGDPAAAARAMVTLARSPTLRRRMGRRARARSAHFTAARATRQTLRIYDELLARTGRAAAKGDRWGRVKAVPILPSSSRA